MCGGRNDERRMTLLVVVLGRRSLRFLWGKTQCRGDTLSITVVIVANEFLFAFPSTSVLWPPPDMRNKKKTSLSTRVFRDSYWDDELPVR